jgi:hypothetical protein
MFLIFILALAAFSIFISWFMATLVSGVGSFPSCTSGQTPFVSILILAWNEQTVIRNASQFERAGIHSLGMRPVAGGSDGTWEYARELRPLTALQSRPTGAGEERGAQPG